MTPAAGYVSPATAVIIGVAAGLVCYFAVALKNRLGWDDALDVWGVHGVGGFLGIVLLGVFASTLWNPAGADGLLRGNPSFLGKQFVAAVVCSAWAFGFTYAMLRADQSRHASQGRRGCRTARTRRRTSRRRSLPARSMTPADQPRVAERRTTRVTVRLPAASVANVTANVASTIASRNGTQPEARAQARAIARRACPPRARRKSIRADRARPQELRHDKTRKARRLRDRRR